MEDEVDRRLFDFDDDIDKLSEVEERYKYSGPPPVEPIP